MQFVLAAPQSFSFYETVHAHGWRQLLPFEWDEEARVLRRVERLGSGAVALLTVRSETDAEILVECSGAEAPEAEIVAKTRRMLQLDIDIDPFHAYCADCPELAHVPERRQGRMLCSPTLFEDVCKVILTTNTTWAQTKSMNARVIAEFGSAWPENPERHAFPAPEQIVSVDAEEFAARAKLGYRAPAVHELAMALAGGALDLHALLDTTLDAEAIWKRLLALRGVGPYAAACLMLYLGRPTRVNSDSWARTLLARELGRKVTDKEVHEFFERFGEWKGLAYNFYAWQHES